MTKYMPMKILMVCLGNICRSPLAEGILQSKIMEYDLPWTVDSAGTSGWHDGESPDNRSIIEAEKNGINISSQRSRRLTKQDLDHFDLILAMDQSNYTNIIAFCSSDAQRKKVKKILDYTYPGENRNVPDPYYENNFDVVFEMLDSALDHMIEEYSY